MLLCSFWNFDGALDSLRWFFRWFVDLKQPRPPRWRRFCLLLLSCFSSLRRGCALCISAVGFTIHGRYYKGILVAHVHVSSLPVAALKIVRK